MANGPIFQMLLVLTVFVRYVLYQICIILECIDATTTKNVCTPKHDGTSKIEVSGCINAMG